MTAILFICRANRYRSPIAAACLKDTLIRRQQEQDWEVSSAGTWTMDGFPPMPDAILEAQRLGLDIRGHRSRVVTADLIQKADLVLVMEQGQKEALQVEFPAHRGKIALLTEVSEEKAYDIIDPVENPLAIEVGPEIHRLIQVGFERICRRATKGPQQRSRLTL